MTMAAASTLRTYDPMLKFDGYVPQAICGWRYTGEARGNPPILQGAQTYRTNDREATQTSRERLSPTRPTWMSGRMHQGGSADHLGRREGGSACCILALNPDTSRHQSGMDRPPAGVADAAYGAS